MRYILLTLSVVVCVAVACNKKPKAPAPGTADILRSGKWKLASGTVKRALPDGRDTTLDYLKFIPECYKDDYFAFDSINQGKRYTGGTTCDASDPQYFSFVWRLSGNNDLLDLYNGLNWVYGVVDTVQPYYVDAITLDTVRALTYAGVPAGTGTPGLPMGGFDIYGGDLSNVTQSTFSLHFQLHTYRMDTTNRHFASFLIPQDPDLNPDELPIVPYYQRDTVDYNLTFSKF